MFKQTTRFEKEKPELFQVDCYGIPFNIGSKVAYNYSGDVRIGTITRIKQYEYISVNGRHSLEGKYWWKIKCHIEIQGIDPNNDKINPQGISIIRNPNSFVVI